jgi:hypothetical protein
VKSFYQKFKKLDSLFAADVVGDGTSEVVGPFEAAKKRFFKGTVIPICAGWYSKVNKDYETLITMLAWEAATGDNSMPISPLVNLDRKGGAYQIMLQHFRRAIGVVIIRGNAKHKLGRLHYVHDSMEETANASTAHHCANKWNPSNNGHASWYNAHTPNGYQTYLQLRNGFFCGLL